MFKFVGRFIFLLLMSCAAIVHAAESDANRDGKTDFILRHEGFPGTWYIAYMNGTESTVVELRGLPLGDGYYLESISDFDGDGYLDVMLRDGLNNFYVYLIANGAVKRSGRVTGLPNLPYWQTKLRRDFDSDGKTDLLLYSQADGQAMICYMDGIAVKSSCKKVTGFPAYFSGNYYGTEIKTAGGYSSPNSVAFAADRWNLSTFEIERWYYTLNLFTLKVTGSRWTELEAVADVSWVPIGSADFDKDGKSEIVMSNNLTTEWMVVKLNGRKVVKTTSLFYAYAWELAAGRGGLRADLWGNGKRQIITRHPSLNYYYYSEFDGTSIVSEGYVNLPTFPVARKALGALSD